MSRRQIGQVRVQDARTGLSLRPLGEALAIGILHYRGTAHAGFAADAQKAIPTGIALPNLPKAFMVSFSAVSSLTVAVDTGADVSTTGACG
jgi:hypothetical protein